MTNMLMIIIGLFLIGLAIDFMRKILPYLLGLGLIAILLMFLSSLQSDKISALAAEAMVSVVIYIFIIVGSVLLVETPLRKIIYPVTVIGLILVALEGESFIVPLLTIAYVLWNWKQKNQIVKNIASCPDVDEDVKFDKVFVVATGVIVSLYIIYGRLDYLFMLLMSFFILDNALRSHALNFEKIQAGLKTVGYIEVEAVLENILSGNIKDKDTYIHKILERTVEHNKSIHIEGKKEYFILLPIYEKIVQGVKERKSIEQIKNMVQNLSESEIPREVVVAVKTAGNIELGICLEPRMANFALMKYSFSNHPMVEECEKVKQAYWEGMDFVLHKYRQHIVSLDILRKNLINILNLNKKGGSLTNNTSDVMKLIIKASNVFWHGGFRFGKKDIRYLFLLESMYIVAVSLGHIDYDTMREYCKLLKIPEKEYKQSEVFLERIFQPYKEIKDIIDGCKNRALRLAMVYVSKEARELMRYPSLPRYRVAVCATMSSGKSTFVNALLGRDFIPSSNQACTAKVTTIEDNDILGQKVLGSSMTLRGEIFYEDNVSPDKLKEWNMRNDISSVYLEADLQNISSEENVLVVYDTPGTNYSQDATHKAQTMDFLKSHEVDMILYLINAEHSSTNDNKILLSELKENILSGRKKKLIFLINKFDSLEEDDIKALVDDVRNELEEMGFDSPVILPISSNAARLFRMAMAGEEFTKRELIEFEDMFDLFAVEKFDVTEYLESGLRNIGRKEMTTSNGVVKVGGKEYDKASLMEATRRTGIMAVTAYVNQEIRQE